MLTCRGQNDDNEQAVVNTKMRSDSQGLVGELEYAASVSDQQHLIISLEARQPAPVICEDVALEFIQLPVNAMTISTDRW